MKKCSKLLVLLFALTIFLSTPLKVEAASLRAPASISVKTSNGNPKITWDKVSGAAYYRVYRQTETDTKWVKVANTKKTSYIDKKWSAAENSTIKYRVKAVNSNGVAGKVSATKKWVVPVTELVISTGSADVTLEFTDGTKKTWKTGDDKISLGKKTLAYIYFGSYPQTEVTGTALTEAITGATYDEDGVTTVDGVKYKRLSKENATFSSASRGYYHWSDKTYAYFKYEPIKWRVLSNNSGNVLLLSEYGIDHQKYNNTYTSISWADCTLRSWLNKNFYSTAFSTNESSLIQLSSLVNENNPIYNTRGGEPTKDKVYLLSIADMTNTKYGFSKSLDDYDINRRCASTDYAKAMGAWTTIYGYETSEGQASSSWWLRSPGDYTDYAVYVSDDGKVHSRGDWVGHVANAVRPALQLNLKSVID